MYRKVVEPSEILREGEEARRPHDQTPSAISNPWIRFLARMVDYCLFFGVLEGLHTLFYGPTPFGKWESLIPFQFFVWIPIEAAFLAFLGKTPGKWFLNIDIRQGRKTHPDYGSALKRSFNVWFRGIGMGIPFINVLCMFIAFTKLKTLHITSWDREDNFQVTHRFVPTWKLAIASIMAFAAIGFYWFR